MLSDLGIKQVSQTFGLAVAMEAYSLRDIRVVQTF